MDTEMRNQMEAHLLSEAAVSQAKILNVGSSGADPEWTVALVLAEAENNSQEADALALKTVRKSLISKMRKLGDGRGKSLVPKKWVMPGGLPLTESGHVDEDALREKLVGSTSDSGPQSVEDKIKRVASIVLRRPGAEIDMSKTFIQLGGDSILSIELMSRLMEEEIPVQVPDIVGPSTLNELAAGVVKALNEVLAVEAAVATDKIPQATTVSAVPIAA